MDIEVLKQYKDACALCEDIDSQIDKLHRSQDELLTDCVSGSDSQYPYISRKFTITGLPASERYQAAVQHQIALLVDRKAGAEQIKADVEEYMSKIPLRIQRIIRYKIMDGLSWEKTADKMGGRSSGDSLRMELNRYLKKSNEKNF